MALAPKPSSVLWPIDAIRDAAQVGLANVSTDSGGVPRYIPMIYETPEGVVPSFALAAASKGLGPSRSWVRPHRDRETGRGRWTSAITCRCASTGPREASSGSARPRSFAEISIRRRCVAKSSSSGLRRQARGICSRRRSTAWRRARKSSPPQSEISWPATDWRGRLHPSDRCGRGGCASRSSMIALMAMRRAAIGLTLASLVFVLWLGGVFVAFVNGYWLSVASPLAAVSAADGRFRGGAVHCRTPSGDKDCRRASDAGEVSLAAPSRSHLKEIQIFWRSRSARMWR